MPISFENNYSIDHIMLIKALTSFDVRFIGKAYKPLRIFLIRDKNNFDFVGCIHATWKTKFSETKISLINLKFWNEIEKMSLFFNWICLINPLCNFEFWFSKD